MWLERVQGLLELKKKLNGIWSARIVYLNSCPLPLLFLASSDYFSLRRGLVSCLVFWYVRFAVVFYQNSEGLFTARLLLPSIITILLWVGGLFWGGFLTSSCMVTCWQPFFWVDSSYGFFRLLLRYRVRCFYEFLYLFCGFHVYYSSSNFLPLLPTVVPYCFFL